MSRAFTKEDDAGDDLPELPMPEGPNYVTARGVELLRAAVHDLMARRAKAADPKPIDRDLRYLAARIDSAIIVTHGSGPEARFGAAVTLKDENGAITTFRIVGEDEARAGSDLMPWSAPLAQAVLGAKAGDNVSWEGPDGPARYVVVSVAY